MNTLVPHRIVAGTLALEIPVLGFVALLTAGSANTRLLMDGRTDGMSPLGYWAAGAAWLALSAALVVCAHTLWVDRTPLSFVRQATLVAIVLAHLGFAGLLVITPDALVSPAGITMIVASLGLAGFLGFVLHKSRTHA